MLPLADRFPAEASARRSDDVDAGANSSEARRQDRSVRASKASRALDAATGFASRIAGASDMAEIGQALMSVLDVFRDLIHIEILVAPGGRPATTGAALVGSRFTDPVSLRHATADLASEVATTQRSCNRSVAGESSVQVHGLGVPLRASSSLSGAVVLWSSEPFDDFDERSISALCATAAVVLDNERKATISRLYIWKCWNGARSAVELASSVEAAHRPDANCGLR